MRERRICVDLSHDHYFFSEKVSLDLSKKPPEIFLPCRTVTWYTLEVVIVDYWDFLYSSIRVVSDFESGEHSRWVGCQFVFFFEKSIPRPFQNTYRNISARSDGDVICSNVKGYFALGKIPFLLELDLPL